MTGKDEYRPETVAVWDLPLRLFHWLLVATIAGSWITHELGTHWVEWHVRLGYLALGLVTFRVIWGFAGSRHARFGSFLAGPGQAIAYGRAWLAGRPPASAGHSPMGGWAVMVMLMVVGAQGVSGLFQADDFLVEGPWHHAAPQWLKELMHEIHEVNFNILVALIAAHLTVIAVYRVRLGSDLIGAMITGRRRAAPAEGISGGYLIRALLAAAAAAGIVWAVIAAAPQPDPNALF